MNRTRRVRLTVVKGLAALALALGLAAPACGPQQRFCPDSGNGVCPAPYDAPVQSDVMDTAPQEQHSVYIGADDASSDAAADAGAATD
jgi:hypothetical protein